MIAVVLIALSSSLPTIASFPSNAPVEAIASIDSAVSMESVASTPSNDSGESPTQIVTLKTPPDVHEPQAAVDAKGRVYVAYATTALVSISISNDGGATFGDPVAVGAVGKISLGMRRGPRVAATADAVVVSAIGGAQGGGHDGDLVAWRSTTAGVSWNFPVKINDLPGSAREGLHAMGASAKGDVACAWLDIRSGKMEIYCALSSDGGKTFGPNRLVYHSPGGSVCECCHPSLAFDAQSTLYVMFRNELDGARDLYVTESKDGGKTFEKARKLGTGTWKLAACPMDGGSLAIDASGKVTSLWRREQELYASGSDPIEHKVNSGEQPWLASSDKGVYSTWLSRRGGDLWVLAPKSDTPAKIASDANDPMIACSPDGKGPVIAVWESTAHDATAICAARLDSNEAAK
jgi:hypothetical protein